MKLPKKPNALKGFNGYGKPLRPYKPKEFFEKDVIIETHSYDDDFTISGEELQQYASQGVDLYFESRATEYYGSYETSTDVTVRAGKEKVKNPNYDTQLKSYKIEYAKYKEGLAEWNKKKALWDEWQDERRKVKEINQLERLEKKYRNDGVRSSAR